MILLMIINFLLVVLAHIYVHILDIGCYESIYEYMLVVCGKTHAHQDCLVVIKHTDRQTAGTRRLIGYEKHCLLFLRACISLPLFCIVCTLQLYYCSEYLVILFYCSRSLSALQSEKYPLACTCHLFGCLFGLVL